GVYKVTWPSSAARRQSNALGRWRWIVSATDDLGRQSSVQRGFWLNDTLGFMRVAPKAVRLRSGRANAVLARFRLAHSAQVTGSIYTSSGVLIRRLRPVRLSAGSRALSWNGRFPSGRLVYTG